MSSCKTIIVALLTVSSVLAAPHFKLVTRAAPKLITGPASSYPAMSTWVDFNTTLTKYTPSMISAGDTQGDVSNIATAVQSVASEKGIDPRVVLALLLQESTGYVGVQTTIDVDGEGTGGMLQASGCQGYPGQNGLTEDQIKTMISCGITHFAGNFKEQGGHNTAETVYSALREYNSGSVDKTDLSVTPNGAGVASYVSDISQRLQGVVF